MIITSSLLVREPYLIDLVDKFILRLPVLHKAIMAAYKSENKDEFLGLLHQLKGVGGNYGYDIITEQCAKIELQAKNNNDVNALLDDFTIVVEQILAGNDENHKIAEQNK